MILCLQNWVKLTWLRRTSACTNASVSWGLVWNVTVGGTPHCARRSVAVAVHQASGRYNAVSSKV